jgi:hypothetical protein
MEKSDSQTIQIPTIHHYNLRFYFTILDQLWEQTSGIQRSQQWITIRKFLSNLTVELTMRLNEKSWSATQSRHIIADHIIAKTTIRKLTQQMSLTSTVT